MSSERCVKNRGRDAAVWLLMYLLCPLLAKRQRSFLSISTVGFMSMRRSVTDGGAHHHHKFVRCEGRWIAKLRARVNDFPPDLLPMQALRGSF